MNLLPPEYKKELRYEAWRRYIEFLGIYFGLGLVVANALVLPSLFFLSFQLDVLKERLTVLNQSQEFRLTSQGESKLGAANKLLGLVINFDKENKPASPVVEDILRRINTNIFLSSFLYERQAGQAGTISVSGLAEQRNNLSLFIEELKRSPFVKEVDSPYSNYLKEKNITFSLIIALNQ